MPLRWAAWAAGARTIYCEFENPKHYRDTVRRFRELQAADQAADASIWVAPPRIFKPGEDWILRQVRSCEADGYLVHYHIPGEDAFLDLTYARVGTLRTMSTAVVSNASLAVPVSGRGARAPAARSPRRAPPGAARSRPAPR